MLYVTAVIRAQAEHADAVGAALGILAAASRLEPGCEHYEVFRDTREPSFITHETWASAEAEKAHLRGANVAQLVNSVGAYLAAPAEIHRCSPIS